MEHFTPISASIGGALIGLAASLLLLLNGRIAGISGIYGGLLQPVAGDVGWRAAFTAGLVAGGGLLAVFMPWTISGSDHRGLVATVFAGLLVGFGVRLGNGCTSGHGVCGLTRLSWRSFIAVATFITTGVLTASAIQLWAGGSL